VCKDWLVIVHQHSSYVTSECCILAVTEWYGFVQSVYCDRLIHLSTVCVLWQTDTPQYSLRIMPADSPQYSLRIMPTDSPQYSLRIMPTVHLSTVYVLCQLIHLSTVYTLCQLIHVRPGSNCLASLFIQTCCCLQCTIRSHFSAAVQSPCPDAPSINVWITCWYQDGSWGIPWHIFQLVQSALCCILIVMSLMTSWSSVMLS
jgi:hypothetical protein